MNVELTPQLEELVAAKIRSGRYHSGSEVVSEALRLLEERDELRGVQLREVRERIDRGLAEVHRGEGVDGETFVKGLMEELDNRESNRKAR